MKDGLISAYMKIKVQSSSGARINSGSFFFTLLLAGAVLFGPGAQRCAAQSFPGAAGDEYSYSIGVFQLTVDPAFAYLFTAYPNTPGHYYYPGYTPSSGVLTSPIMYDFNDTYIGVSASHSRNVGSPVYFAGPGVQVGTPAIYPLYFPDFIPSYSSYAVLPPAFAIAPNGIDEIMTEIESFNLATTTGSAGQLSCSNADPRVPSVPVSVNMVVAGPAYIPNLPQNRRSIGMVQQLTPTVAGTDFPAQSFFDIYVEVTLPPVSGNNTANDFPGALSGIPLAPGQTQDGAVLYNDASDPLVIINTNVTSLPPTAVYIHGMTVAVPMKFKYANPPYWAADEVMGYLVLAGHGVIPNPSNDCTAVAASITTVLNQTLGTNGAPFPGMPVPWLQPTNSFPTPGSGYNSIARTFVDPTTGQTNVNEDTVSFVVGTQIYYLRDLSLGSLGTSASLPSAGNSQSYNSSSATVNFQISENGVDFYPATLSGSTGIKVYNTNVVAGSTTTYSMQMTQLTASGTWAGGNVYFRENPAQPTLGQHTVAPDPRGYRVSSFFDVFTEFSPDNVSWYPANRSLRVLASVPPALPSSVFASRSGTNVVLQWQNNFTLQSTTNINLPFTDMPGPVTNGFYTTPVSQAPAKFYRLIFRP